MCSRTASAEKPFLSRMPRSSSGSHLRLRFSCSQRQKSASYGLKTIKALLKTDEVSVQEAAVRFGVSRSTLYRNGLALNRDLRMNQSKELLVFCVVSRHKNAQAKPHVLPQNTCLHNGGARSFSLSRRTVVWGGRGCWRLHSWSVRFAYQYHSQ
jgi:helix-turn-helix, Psq domain